MSTEARKPVRRLQIIMALVIVLMLLAVETVAAEGGDETVALGGDEPVSAVLKGGWHAGAFDYYKVEYPGDVEMRISAEFRGMDATLFGFVGFNVYGPGGYEEQGAVTRESPTLELFYRRDEAATLYVQVYNYSIKAVSYTIKAEGAATVEIDEGAVGADDGSGTAETTEGDTLSGTIVGDRAGAFDTYSFWYDGSGDDVSVRMTFAPSDPSFGNALGFEIWVPGKGLPTRGVAPKNVFGLHRAVFASDVAGEYMIKVYNYADGVPMRYDLTVNDQ